MCMDVATFNTITQDIRGLEGFKVVIRGNGRYRRNLPPYDYIRAARNRFTVADWKRARFHSNYPDIEVDVVLPDGRIANGMMRLLSLREEYEYWERYRRPN